MNTKKKHPRGTPSDPHNEPLPGDFVEKAKQRYAKFTKPEVTFEQHLDLEKAEFRRMEDLGKGAALAYQPAIGTITPCGNGDLEKLLDPAEWQGAFGSLPLAATNPFASFTVGLFPGAITNFNTHQTWVGAGTDPNVGIPTTAQGSAGAVRIGNAFSGLGCELLSKTFIVTPAVSTITFWYAAVLQNPIGHPPNTQPFFWVRVTDASGTVVPGAFDFGAGSDMLIANNTNPFFQSKVVGQETVVYRDWSCAQIDLSTQVGKQVTIEFVTADCGLGAHWGYAYIDSFCGNCKGSPTGNITYDCEASTHCGPGRICFDYQLPSTKDPKGNTITGTVVITLDIYQNGALLTQLTSPTLTSGSSYCFNITPASIPGINTALGGFDFVATGAFAIGTTNLGHIKVGSPPDGITPGKNNDYQIACKTCEEIKRDQDAYLNKNCAHKFNLLPRTNCDCPDSGALDRGDCHCDCIAVKLPDIKPCISVGWGDSQCDCLETDDVEVLCITVCNCYSNVTFEDLSIGHILVTDMAGNPVPNLPNGAPSVQVIPSGPICFGDIGPCRGRNQPSCVSRELVLYTRGAIGKDYRLSFEGVCFKVTHHFQSEQCFIVKLCQD
ncbi:MAG: hypothetical protein WAM82_29270 [Thermoanaerobaculia bacterium]